jgi:hypothetical protein
MACELPAVIGNNFAFGRFRRKWRAFVHTLFLCASA